MKTFPVNFLVMPHTSETNKIIEGLLFENETFMGYVNYLAATPTVAVVDKGEFCGFLIKDDISEQGVVEIHFFIYPSKRRVVLPLFKAIKKEMDETGKTLKTSVHSTHQYLVPILERFGAKVVGTDEEYAMRDGNLIGLTYLEYKGV